MKNPFDWREIRKSKTDAGTRDFGDENFANAAKKAKSVYCRKSTHIGN